MSDIAKCTGERTEAWNTVKCPFRYSCRKFTAPAVPLTQRWLNVMPYVAITHSCHEYESNKPVQLQVKTEATT